jgi:hypothetical protein
MRVGISKAGVEKVGTEKRESADFRRCFESCRPLNLRKSGSSAGINFGDTKARLPRAAVHNVIGAAPWLD